MGCPVVHVLVCYASQNKDEQVGMFDISNFKSITVYYCWLFFVTIFSTQYFLLVRATDIIVWLVAQHRTGSRADTHVARRQPIPTLTENETQLLR